MHGPSHQTETHLVRGRLQHAVERIVLEQIAFFQIGPEGRVTGVPAELLELRGMHAPVLGGVHRAALERVAA